MNGLLLHCGAQVATIDDVSNVRTPEATDSHFPIPHEALIDRLYSALGSLELEVTQCAHALNNGGETYFGMFEVRDPKFDQIGDEWAYVFGLRNDHGKRFAAEAVAGERVFVCDNLAFTGRYRFGRKHTRYILRDLPRLTSDVVSRAWAGRIEREWQIKRWRETPISQRIADHLILQGLRQKAITASRIEQVVAEFQKPSHEEHLTTFHDEDGIPISEERTLWTLHNAFTEALKGSSLRELPGRTMRLQAVLDGYRN